MTKNADPHAMAAEILMAMARRWMAAHPEHPADALTVELHPPTQVFGPEGLILLRFAATIRRKPIKPDDDPRSGRKLTDLYTGLRPTAIVVP